MGGGGGRGGGGGGSVTGPLLKIVPPGSQTTQIGEMIPCAPHYDSYVINSIMGDR